MVEASEQLAPSQSRITLEPKEKALRVIQFVTFRRDHPGTPIDLAPVLFSGIICFTSHSFSLANVSSRTSPSGGNRVHRSQKAFPNRAPTDEGRPSCVCPATVLRGLVRAFSQRNAWQIGWQLELTRALNRQPGFRPEDS